MNEKYRDLVGRLGKDGGKITMTKKEMKEEIKEERNEESTQRKRKNPGMDRGKVLK